MSQQKTFQNLGSLPICVAIDKSGSTYGKTLEAEISVVQEICRLRSPNNNHPIYLLPWCDETLEPIKLPEETVAMQSLVGGGGTDPGVLYSSTAYLKAIQDSGVWFLLTDGLIQDSLVENFALKTAKLRLHNKSCVVIVFDSFNSGPPAACNISVGIATYAVAPNCLFLFHDIPTSKVRIMQAKGSFNKLLPMTNHEHVQPVLNKYTTWAELPRMAYEDISRIQLASVRALDEQEVALADGLIVKMPDLLSGRADPETVEKIVRDDDNLKSIVLASMTRGTGKDLEAWLESQQKPMPKMSGSRFDVNGEAQKAVAQLLEALSNHAEEAVIESLRESLRSAHEANLRVFKKERAWEYENYEGHRHHNKRVKNAHRIKKNKDAEYNLWTYGQNAFPMDDSDEEDMVLKDLHGSTSVDPIFMPGFTRKEPIDEFTGSCMLCHRTSVLALLLKSPPNLPTANFPRQGSYSKLTFPLAMGSFAEMDIISYFVCCDCCAYHLSRNGTGLDGETITGALCLVGINDNQGAWLEKLETAVKGRFEIKDLWTVCIAILDRMLAENGSRNIAMGDNSLFRDSARWSIRRLVKVAQVPSTLSPAFGNAQNSSKLTYLNEILTDRNFTDPGHAGNVDIYLLRYPVQGFMAIFRLLRDHMAKEQLQTVLFQRLLFRLMEVFFSEKGPSATSASNKVHLDEILCLDRNQAGAGSSIRLQQNIVINVAIAELAKHNLVEPELLSSFQTLPEFEDVEKQTGPAVSVFLHHLAQYGGVYGSPIACFNAMKGNTLMREVLLTPLAIGEEEATGLISQLLS